MRKKSHSNGTKGKRNAANNWTVRTICTIFPVMPVPARPFTIFRTQFRSLFKQRIGHFTDICLLAGNETKKTITKRERNNIHAGTAGLSRGTYSLSLALFLFRSLCLDFWTMHAMFGTFSCKRKIKQCSGMLAFHIIISFISTKYLLWTAVSVLDTVAATRWKIYVETVRMIPVDCERNNIFPFPAIASFAPLLPSQPS